MKINMDSHAITMRLKQTSELRRLCLALGSKRLKDKMQKQIKVDYLKSRAKKGKRTDFDKVLKKVPDRGSLEWDKIMEKHKIEKK